MRFDNERQSEVRERFEREVDAVKGAGGFAPTLSDMRAFGRQMDEAALPTRAEQEAYYREEGERVRAEFDEIEAENKRAASES